MWQVKVSLITYQYNCRGGKFFKFASFPVVGTSLIAYCIAQGKEDLDLINISVAYVEKVINYKEFVSSTYAQS